MKARLYDEYIRRLMEVNDETVTEAEHNRLSTEFYGWQQGVEDAKGFRFNGDYYYIDLGIDRPMCCGVLGDWKERCFWGLERKEATDAD